MWESLPSFQILSLCLKWSLKRRHIIIWLLRQEQLPAVSAWRFASPCMLNIFLKSASCLLPPFTLHPVTHLFTSESSVLSMIPPFFPYSCQVLLIIPHKCISHLPMHLHFHYPHPSPSHHHHETSFQLSHIPLFLPCFKDFVQLSIIVPMCLLSIFPLDSKLAAWRVRN